jgi:hypothetical protein
MIVGVPMKCGLSASTGIVTMDAARLRATIMLGIINSRCVVKLLVMYCMS